MRGKMTTTLLTHKKCKKPVVLDLGQSIKLFAPSFGFNSMRVDRFTMDIKIFSDSEGEIKPEYCCLYCREVLDEDSLKSEVICSCQICGEADAVENMSVHSQVATICESCLKKIRSGEYHDSRLMEYVNLFGLKKNLRVTPLYKVLTSSISV
jgi:hypothetical protein